MLASMGDRIKHGGIPAKQHRIYYFNTKEIIGNKYGTPSPIPYKIVDPDINLKLLISLRCNGEYSYRIINPAAFYGFCGNVADTFTREKIDSQLKSEIITNLAPAFAKLGVGLEYQELPAHNLELVKILNEQLSSEWRDIRGIEIVKFGISVNALPEDEARIKQLQAAAVMRDPTMAAASLVSAQSDAMRTAASNPNGAGMAFMGMGMAANAGGMNAQNLYAMGQQGGPQGGPQGQSSGPAPAGGAGWACSCGHAGNTGKFCADCGKTKPASNAGWKCECGTVNGGKFCANCGKPKPQGQPLYRCDKCGWEPPDPKNMPKFCPECGDVFDENDIKK
jgi:membrane protease subunit (stomatin/prohibitin family)